jgi:hypothetical protein
MSATDVIERSEPGSTNANPCSLARLVSRSDDKCRECGQLLHQCLCEPGEYEDKGQHEPDYTLDDLEWSEEYE